MNENNDPRNMVCFELQNKKKPTTKRKSERPRCPRCRRHDRARDRLRIYAVRPHQPAEKRPRLLRGDVGYGGDENMCEAEKRGLMHLFKIRRTKTVLALLRQYENSREWIDAGEGLQLRPEDPRRAREDLAEPRSRIHCEELQRQGGRQVHRAGDCR